MQLTVHNAAIAPGLFLLHKSAGETSFSHVQTALEEVRRRGLNRMPVCHGGALDPFASGLLLLLAGQTTRLQDVLHAVPKTYVATVTWGAETDNGDPLGVTVARGDAAALTPERLDEALRPFLGWTDQVPPAHSNKRVGGERAYVRAHRGESFTVPPSRVYLHTARWLRHELPVRSVLELTCRGGYYVRSLARDLGRATGARAHLHALHRTAIGPWSDPPAGARHHVSGRAILPWCAARVLSDQELGELRAHRPVAPGALIAPAWFPPPDYPLEPPPPLIALHRDRLVALLRHEGDGLAATALLRGGL